jgi:hypothetical protein
MSVKLSRKDRNLLLGAGFVFLLLIVAALLFSSGERAQSEYPSSYSTASGGAKAAYLLLSDTGYKVQRWERPLSDLPQFSGAEGPERGRHDEPSMSLGLAGHGSTTACYGLI